MEETITKDDFNRILKDFENNLVEKILDKLLPKLPVKQFYTVKEFSERTGLDEQTIVNYAKSFSIKATQKASRGQWMIKASELDRLIKEAEEHRLIIMKNTGKRNLQIIKHQGTIDKKK